MNLCIMVPPRHQIPVECGFRSLGSSNSFLKKKSFFRSLWKQCFFRSLGSSKHIWHFWWQTANSTVSESCLETLTHIFTTHIYYTPAYGQRSQPHARPAQAHARRAGERLLSVLRAAASSWADPCIYIYIYRCCHAEGEGVVGVWMF